MQTITPATDSTSVSAPVDNSPAKTRGAINKARYAAALTDPTAIYLARQWHLHNFAKGDAIGAAWNARHAFDACPCIVHTEAINDAYLAAEMAGEMADHCRVAWGKHTGLTWGYFRRHAAAMPPPCCPR